MRSRCDHHHANSALSCLSVTVCRLCRGLLCHLSIIVFVRAAGSRLGPCTPPAARAPRASLNGHPTTAFGLEGSSPRPVSSSPIVRAYERDSTVLYVHSKAVPLTVRTSGTPVLSYLKPFVAGSTCDAMRLDRTGTLSTCERRRGRGRQASAGARAQ